MSSHPTSKDPHQASSRKVYSPPKVRSYGNIRDITQDVGKGSMTKDSFPSTKPAGQKSTAL